MFNNPKREFDQNFMAQLSGKVPPKEGEDSNQSVISHTPESRSYKKPLLAAGAAVIWLAAAFQGKIVDVYNGTTDPSHTSQKDEVAADAAPKNEVSFADASNNVQKSFTELQEILSQEDPDANEMQTAIENIKLAIRELPRPKNLLGRAAVSKLSKQVAGFPSSREDLQKSQEVQEMKEKLRSLGVMWAGVKKFLPKDIVAPVEALKDAKDCVVELSTTLLSENPDADQVEQQIDDLKKAVEQMNEMDASPLLTLVKPMLGKAVKTFDDIWSDPTLTPDEKMKELRREAQAVKDTIETYVPSSR